MVFPTRFGYILCLLIIMFIPFQLRYVLIIAVIFNWGPSLLQKLRFLLPVDEIEDPIFTNILKAFSSIVDEATTHTIGTKLKAVEQPLRTRRRKNVVVGMDRHLRKIKKRLKRGSSMLDIVPVVGMSGIGKTTFATQIFQDKVIRQWFEVCAWTTVSQDSSVGQVVLSILNSAKLQTKHMQAGYGDDIEMLGDRLYKGLKGKSYLIVLDNVWDVNIWGAVKTFLPKENTGSRVLLTTRSSEVARLVNCQGSIRWMHFLDEHGSRRLLKHQIFGRKECPDKLRGIVDEIAGSCKGFPLALVVIGGLLSKMDRTEEKWKSFADTLRSIDIKDVECMEILALSYHHLPHHLRPCFLYMGMFPRDYAVPATKLMQLWAAEGFLQQSHGFKSPEALAEEYLEDLVERNLVIVSDRNYQGKIKRCKIHDVMKKLCLREAWKEKFLFVVNTTRDLHKGSLESYQRVVVHPNILKIHQDILYDKSHRDSRTHSLLSVSTNLDDKLYNAQCKQLHYRLLKVLDILIIHFSKFPLEVCDMVSLRYLAVSFTGMLHPQISRLQNLRTIVHQDEIPHKDDFLPVEIWTMPNLRHLYVPLSCLSNPPSGSNACPLQTVEEVMNMSFGTEILQRIRNLKTLAICYDVGLSTFRGWSGHELQNLAHLNQLENLKLEVIDFITESRISHPSNLLFPPSLRKLSLSGCRIPWERLTIVGKLPNLEVLKLRQKACQGKAWEPVEGQFRKLKFLLLENIDDLMHWRAEGSHFPRLRCLIIKFCNRLEDIPPGFDDIHTLKRIELFNCNQQLVTSAKMIRDTAMKQRTRSSNLEVNVSSSE